MLIHERRLEHLGRLGHEGQARLIKKVRGAARGHDHVKLEELLEGGHREIADLEVLLTVLEQRRRDRVQSSLHGVQAQHRGWTRQFAPAREHASREGAHLFQTLAGDLHGFGDRWHLSKVDGC